MSIRQKAKPKPPKPKPKPVAHLTCARRNCRPYLAYPCSRRLGSMTASDSEPAMLFQVSPTMTRSRCPIRSAVSLVELLVVCAIILFLLALLVPGLGHAKEQARRVQCANNLKQWGVALQLYRDEYNDYIPMEGNTLPDQHTHINNLFKPGTWFNTLPPYLDMPEYREVEGANIAIREFKNGHIWICPSKDLTGAYKSFKGKNQFHYGMNQVLDGLGKWPEGSKDAPGFPEPEKAKPLPGKLFAKKPNTVFLFDIAPNSPAGSPRDVANEYWRNFDGGRGGKFHGNFANLLCLNGSVIGATANDLYSPRDNRHGKIIWHHPQLYWGYPPPSW
jgi:Protein of unknown function (DUF1559)